MRLVRLVPLWLALALTPSSSAFAQIGDTLQFHGAGGWAGGWTSNDNQFFRVASKEGEVRNSYFALNVAAQPGDRLTIHSEVSWIQDLEGSRVDFDYAFAQWKVSDALVLRVGRVRNSFGLYTDIYNVGTLRPFYLLPPGGYLAAKKAYTGVGIGGHVPVGNWEIQYDLIGGELLLAPVTAEVLFGVDPETGQPDIRKFTLDLRGKRLASALLTIRPPVPGLSVGVAYQSGVLLFGLPGEDPDRSHFFLADLEYLTDRISIRGEGSWGKGEADQSAGFVEAAYRVSKHWQVAAQYDWHLQRDEDLASPDDTFREHRGVGVGLNYWTNPSFVIKLNAYRVKGNVIATPVSGLTAFLSGTLERETNVLIVGTQFSF